MNLFIDNEMPLSIVFFRLSKEGSSDAQSSTIDWLELVTAVKIQQQSCMYFTCKTIEICMKWIFGLKCCKCKLNVKCKFALSCTFEFHV